MMSKSNQSLKIMMRILIMNQFQMMKTKISSQEMMMKVNCHHQEKTKKDLDLKTKMKMVNNKKMREKKKIYCPKEEI